MKFRLVLLKEIVLTALSSLLRNKTRSFLTLLGIIIGVATVIMMVSIVEGINRDFRSQMEKLGASQIYISKYEPGIRIGRMPKELRLRKDFTLEDVKALRKLDILEEVVPVVHLFSGQMIRSRWEKTSSAFVIGTSSGYLKVVLYNIMAGRFFTKAEENYRANVAVLGADVADTLFPGIDPIGKYIFIGNSKFKVIGTFEKRGRAFGQTRDNYVVIPITTLLKHYPKFRLGRRLSDMFIIARPKRPELIEEAMDEIVELLRVRRKLRPDQPNDFAIYTQEAFVELYSQITSGVFLVAILIASIALVVGGVGIMNIMLVSVKERTTEIGLRKAIGAKNKHILLQFVVESVTLALLGGLLGMAFGFGVALLINRATSFPAAVTLPGILLGVGVSSAVGLFFGIYPAYKASQLNPIEALRYE